MKRTLAEFMLTIFVLSAISSIAGSVTTHARILETGQRFSVLHILASNAPEPQLPGRNSMTCSTNVSVTPQLRAEGYTEVIFCLIEKTDSNKNIVSAEAKIDLRVTNCSGPMPVVTRVEISRAPSATNANTVTYLSIPIEPINAKVKNRTIRITNVRANVATDIAQEIFSNPNGLSFTMFTTPGPAEGTLRGALIPAKEAPPSTIGAGEMMVVGHCTVNNYANQLVGGFNLIREDAKPDNFNTYGANLSFTHFFERDNAKNSALSRIGVTADFNVNFRKLGGVDLTKTSVLGGATFRPFPSMGEAAGKANITAHALFGVSHLTSSVGSVSVSDNSFTMKLGGALDVNVTPHFFIRPIGVDYAPTFFGTTTQNNVQFTFGAGVRF